MAGPEPRRRTARVQPLPVRRPRQNGRPPAAPPAVRGTGPSETRSLIEKFTRVMAPSTVVIGLLYYFSSTYKNAYFSFFGVRPGELGLSTQDYLLGSPSAVFLPLWFLLTCGLLGLLLAVLVRSRLSGTGRLPGPAPGPGASARRRPGWSRAAAAGTAAAGAVMLLMGYAVFLQPPWWRAVVVHLPPGWRRDLLPPLVVVLGAVLLMLVLRPDTTATATAAGDRTRATARGLLIAILILGLFFDAAQYAAGAGRAQAGRDVAARFPRSTRVLVLSRYPISHYAEGIGYRDLGAERGPYRYQYAGFVVLAKSPSRYYLVSSERRRVRGVTVVLPDDDSVRVVLMGR
jgi:hypothetical protein